LGIVDDLGGLSVDHDGGHSVLASSRKEGCVIEDGFGVKGLAGFFPGLGVDVADGDATDHLSPGVLDLESDRFGAHGFVANHERRILVHTDVGFVTDVRNGNERTIEAIGNIGLANWCTGNNEVVGNVAGLIGDGAGLAFGHIKGFGGIGVKVEGNLGVSVHTLGGDFGFVSIVDHWLFHVALEFHGLRRTVSHRHHSDTVFIENLFHLDGDLVDVLFQDGNRGNKVGESIGVSDGFGENRIRGFDAIDVQSSRFGGGQVGWWAVAGNLYVVSNVVLIGGGAGLVVFGVGSNGFADEKEDANFGNSLFTLGNVVLFGAVFDHFSCFHIANFFSRFFGSIAYGKHWSSFFYPILADAKGYGVGSLIVDLDRVFDVGMQFVGTNRLLPCWGAIGCGEGRHRRQDKAVECGTHCRLLSFGLCCCCNGPLAVVVVF